MIARTLITCVDQPTPTPTLTQSTCPSITAEALVRKNAELRLSLAPERTARAAVFETLVGKVTDEWRKVVEEPFFRRRNYDDYGLWGCRDGYRLLAYWPGRNTEHHIFDDWPLAPGASVEALRPMLPRRSDESEEFVRMAVGCESCSTCRSYRRWTTCRAPLRLEALDLNTAAHIAALGADTIAAAMAIARRIGGEREVVFRPVIPLIWEPRKSVRQLVPSTVRDLRPNEPRPRPCWLVPKVTGAFMQRSHVAALDGDPTCVALEDLHDLGLSVHEIGDSFIAIALPIQ